MKKRKWNRVLLTKFLRSQTHQQICILDQRNRAFLVGMILAVLEMDLCSSTLSEVSLEVESKSCDVYLTMHDQFLGIHVLFLNEKTEQPLLSFPWEIPYVSLQLELVQERMNA